MVGDSVAGAGRGRQARAMSHLDLPALETSFDLSPPAATS